MRFMAILVSLLPVCSHALTFTLQPGQKINYEHKGETLQMSCISERKSEPDNQIFNLPKCKIRSGTVELGSSPFFGTLRVIDSTGYEHSIRSYHCNGYKQIHPALIKNGVSSASYYMIESDGTIFGGTNGYDGGREFNRKDVCFMSPEVAKASLMNLRKNKECQ